MFLDCRAVCSWAQCAPVTLRCAQNFSVMRVPLSCAIHYSSHSDHWALEIRPVGPKTWSKFQLIQQPRVAYGCHSKQHGSRKLGQVRKAASPLGFPVSFSVLGEPLGGQAESWVNKAGRATRLGSLRPSESKWLSEGDREQRQSLGLLMVIRYSLPLLFPLGNPFGVTPTLSIHH